MASPVTATTRSATAETDRERTAWLPTVEALRAVAAGVVVAHHTYTLSFYDSTHPRQIFPGWRVVEGFGSLGVNLFFLLSGFLLCEYFWRPKAARSLRSYYIRRYLRIAPAYYVNVAILFLFLADHRNVFSASGVKQTAAQLTFTHWFSPATRSSINVNGALWTLSIEMVLYAVMPLIAIAVFRRPLLATVGLLALGMGYRVYVAASGGPLVRWWFGTAASPDSTDARRYLARQFLGLLPVFMVGIGIRWLIVNGRLPAALTRPHARARISVLVGLLLPSALLLQFGAEPSTDFRHRVWFVLFDVATAALLIPVLVYAARPITGDLGAPMRAANWLGQRSYGLYLWHFPVILVVYGRGAMTGDPVTTHLWLRVIVIVAASVALAAASWRLVEKPAMAYGRALTRPRRRPAVPEGGMA